MPCLWLCFVLCCFTLRKPLSPPWGGKMAPRSQRFLWSVQLVAHIEPLEAFWLALLSYFGPITESNGIALLWSHDSSATWLTSQPESSSARRDISTIKYMGAILKAKRTNTIHDLWMDFGKLQSGAESSGCIPKSVSFPHTKCPCSKWMRIGRSDERTMEGKGRNHLGRPKHQRRNEKRKQEK